MRDPFPYLSLAATLLLLLLTAPLWAAVSLGAMPRIDERSDLQLEHLVATCEKVAIREALRRSQNNKSEASRLLGLSRNGLAMKMRRYGIRGEG